MTSPSSLDIPPAPPRRRTIAVSVGLAVGTVLLFSRTLGFGFVNYDDPTYVTANPHVQGGLTWAGLRWAFAGRSDYWHPLTWMAHMLDWQLYGSAAWGHHLSSVLWQALNAVLVFLVFRRLAGAFWRSAFAAALFAWHPLRVESVAWIAERKDVMSGAFFLLTVLAYARYADARKAGRAAWGRYGTVLGLFAAGLMCKPMLVTVPLVLLVLDCWPLGRGGSLVALRGLMLEKLPFFALSAADAVVTLVMQKHEGAFVLHVSLSARIGNAVVSLARYLEKFVWPADLIVCYEHPGAWPWVTVGLVGAGLLALAILAWRLRRSKPCILAGMTWFLVMLVPVLGLVQVGFQAMADRYTYLPMLGVELALIWGLPEITGPARRRVAAAGAVALLAACAARTWAQEAVWRDSVTLFAHAVRVSPDNDIAEGFLASAYYSTGNYDEAAAHAERARSLNPRNDRVLVLLAGLSERKGDVGRAIRLYREALALRPGDPQVQCQLGLLEYGAGRVEEAREAMTAALRSDPALAGRTLEIARGAIQKGDGDGALFLFRVVLSVQPENPEANGWVGALLLSRGDAAGAIGPLRLAAAGAPGSTEVQLTLARCAAQLARDAEAAAALAKAESDAADNPALLTSVAAVYAQLRNYSAAARIFRRVVALEPDNAKAHASLGYFLLVTGDRAGGLAEWRRALQLDPNLPGLRERLDQAER